MSKYSQRDDGKVVDGKVVVFLKPRRSADGPKDGPRSGAKGEGDAADATAKAGGADAAADAALAEKAKSYKFHIEVQLHAAGGTPLAGEKVRILDPDSNEAVNVAETDAKGVLRAKVPEKKDYHIFVHDEPAPDHPDVFADSLEGTPPDHDRHAVLWVLLVDGKGAPLAGEKLQIEAEGVAAKEAETNAQGCIDMIVEPGVFTVQARGKKLVAHSVFHDEVKGDAPPYKFVLR